MRVREQEQASGKQTSTLLGCGGNCRRTTSRRPPNSIRGQGKKNDLRVGRERERDCKTGRNWKAGAFRLQAKP